MIITRTPYRISFFGGGTDYPLWFRENGGAVLATSINHYCYVSCRFFPPFFENLSRLVWSKIELVGDNSEIEHPAIRAVTQHLGLDDGLEIHHQGDLPARSGLGSSSAFTVGLLHALHALRGEMVSKEDLARTAIHVEQVLMKENVGVQDQIQTAFGGLNRIDISTNGSFHVRPVPLSDERLAQLESHVLLIYTGVSRTASEVVTAQLQAMGERKRELHEIRRLVDEALHLLHGHGDMGDLGRLLHESWLIKRSLSAKISPGFVDDIYARARAAGALGGKLLGAGGGGFIMLFVRPEDHLKVLQALSELLVVPIQFEAGGSQLVYYDPVRYSRTARKRRDYRRYGAEDVEGEIAPGPPEDRQ